MTIRAPKDFWTGIMFIAFAAVAILTARGYPLGTAVRMGPGYFPMLLGIVLGGLGLILVLQSLIVEGEAIGLMRLLPLAVITISVCLFGVFIAKLGLVVTLAAVVAVSAFASRESRPLEVAGLTLMLCVFSVGIFVYGLRLALPLWPSL